MGHFTSENLSDNSIYMYEFVGGYADKTIGLAFGFVYTGFAANAYSTAGTNNYNGSMMGAKVFYSPPKWRWMLVGLSYYPGASLSESTPTTTNDRSGSAMSYDAGFNITLGGAWQTSLKLSYYSLNMRTSTSGSSASATGYNRNLVFPTASIRYGF